MTTGDLKNNLRKLTTLLRQVSFKDDVDYDGMSKGLPAAFLPIYHFVLTGYSRHVAVKLSEMNIHLLGTADLRFVDLMYRVLRDLFEYKPGVPKEKFFSAGFAERKVIMCAEVIAMVHKFHRGNEPKKVKKVVGKNDSQLVCRKTFKDTSIKEVPQKEVPLKEAPKKEAKRPMSAPVAPPRKAEQKKAYIPEAYGSIGPVLQPLIENHVSFANDTLDADLPAVEVVKMNGSSLRPIDIVAQTPARPNTRPDSHAESRTESLLKIISERMDDLAASLLGMEERVVSMETTLSNQLGNEGAAGPPQVPPSATTETMLARMTLVEARLKGVEAKIAATTRNGPVVAGPTAEEWADLANGNPPISTILPGLPSGSDITSSSDTISATELDQAMLPTNSEVFLDIPSDREDSSVTCSPIEPRKMPKVVPSPVVKDLIRQVVRENGSESDSSTPRVSTPTETGGDHSLSTAFTTLSDERREQALRIESMMKETKNKLNHS